MNNFTNNQAEIEGGAVKYISKRPRNLTENYFSNNSAIYGKNLASYPIRLRLYNESKLFQYDSLFILRNEVSNSQLSQKIIFGLFDTDDQECILINTG